MAKWLNGTKKNDVLTGTEGNDYLVGWAGADTLNGGLGNDRYYVENLGDTIVDSGGRDYVYSSVNFTLTNDLEVLTLSGGAIEAIGNDFANHLVGNSQNNLIEGKGGNDYLFGKSGLDTLRGGDGNDYLSGGKDQDTMWGGDGNDVYIVDNDKDIVIEDPNNGYDRVKSSVDYLLPENVEKLNLVGDARIAFGNSLDNKLIGNEQNNAFTSLKGNDYLQGNSGDDRYYFFAGDGLDRIADKGSDAADAVIFASEIQEKDIAFFAKGHDLKVKYGVGDVITVKNYKSSANAIEIFEADSGATADVNAIINHIANYETNNDVNFSSVDEVANDAKLMQEIQVYWS